MRIITGKARGAKLETLSGDATRPTLEKTKMAIFNTLQFDIEGRNVLDLFGGSGQMALEALSRGAEKAFVCESNPDAFEIIKKNAQKTKLFSQVRLVCTDYKSALKSLSGKEKFGLIFLDPPYDTDYIKIALHKIVEGDMLTDSGYIVCESDKAEPFTHEGLKVYRHGKYGKTYITILEKSFETEDEE